MTNFEIYTTSVSPESQKSTGGAGETFRPTTNKDFSIFLHSLHLARIYHEFARLLPTFAR